MGRGERGAKKQTERQAVGDSEGYDWERIARQRMSESLRDGCTMPYDEFCLRLGHDKKNGNPDLSWCSKRQRVCAAQNGFQLQRNVKAHITCEGRLLETYVTGVILPGSRSADGPCNMQEYQCHGD
jgi:hypothetical protein